MAERKDLAQDTACSVCLESFQEPKVLPCCHSFCLKCLKGILKRSKDKKTIDCPQCKTKHQIPPNGPQGFISDYTITTRVDTKKKKQPLVCNQCEERGKAVSYCPTCTEYLCEECLRAHKRLKAYRGHETVDTTSKQFPKVKQPPSKTYNCSIHPKESLKLYCKTCSTLACVLCFVGSHNGHDIGSIDRKTRNQEEKAIRDLVKKTEPKLKEFEQNLQYIAEIEQDTSEQSAALKAAVDKKIDSLITELEARRTELHKKIDDETTKDQKELWAQKEYHETNIVSLKGALQFARQSLNCQEDTELLALCSQVCTRLKELSQLNWDSRSIKDIELKEIQFEQQTSGYGSGYYSHTSSIQELIGDIKTARVQGDHSSSSVTLECIKEMESYVEVGRVITCQIQAVTRIRSKVRHDVDLTGSAECTIDDYDDGFGTRRHNTNLQYQTVTVKKNGPENTWTVTLTPPKPGYYTITFTAQGKYRGETLYSSYKCGVEVEYFDPVQGTRTSGDMQMKYSESRRGYW